MRTARPGTGERLAPDNFLRQAQFEPKLADLVLEQAFQRLDQRNFMCFGRPPTLWWLLIIAAGLPAMGTDSMTSG